MSQFMDIKPDGIVDSAEVQEIFHYEPGAFPSK
jgi:hypothetical protein